MPLNQEKLIPTPMFLTSCLLLCHGEVITKGSNCVIGMDIIISALLK